MQGTINAKIITFLKINIVLEIFPSYSINGELKVLEIEGPSFWEVSPKFLKNKLNALKAGDFNLMY